MEDLTMTEQQLLKELDIPDWRHMSKDKLIAFANNMAELDPEVAKAAIAQFPKFSEMGTEIVRIMSTSLDQIVENEKNVDQKAYELNKQILNSLDKRLQKRFLLPGERKLIIDAMVQVSNNLATMDKHHKIMIGDAFKAVGKTAAGVVLVGGALLGAKLLGKKD